MKESATSSVNSDRRSRASSSLTGPLSSNLFFSVVLLGALALRLDFVQFLHVASSNMGPTLSINDRVFVRAYLGKPALGDVVAFRSPFDADRLHLARIVALGGDRIALTEAGLMVDDQAVAVRLPAQGSGGGDDPGGNQETASCAARSACEITTPPASANSNGNLEQLASAAEDPEIWLGREDPCPGSSCLIAAESLGDHVYFTRQAGELSELLVPPRTVPENYVFVLSDNRIDERDSRIYGAIPESAIVGVASFVYYASDETGIRWDRISRRVS